MSTELELSIRLWEQSDWPEFERWWLARKLAPVHPSQLPKLGVVVEDGGGPVAAAWLYMDNSVGMARLAHPVVAPECPPRESHAALGLAIDFLCMEASVLGYGAIETTTSMAGLVKLFQRNGFLLAETNMSMLVKVL